MKNLKDQISKLKDNTKQYRLSYLLIPLVVILTFFTILIAAPVGSSKAITEIFNFLTGTTGVLYLIYGLVFVALVGILAFSKIGKIRLGSISDKPIKTFSWGSMIFTSTMAADILFFALHEWSIYSQAAGEITAETNAYPFFHWGITPWAFYIILTAIYGFMFYTKKKRNAQRISEACRPILGKWTDKAPGKVIDIIAIISLLLGTATTFGVATPLITAGITRLSRGVIPNTWYITISVLAIIAILYTVTILKGYKSLEKIAKICVLTTGIFLALFFIMGGPMYIIGYGIEGIGYMISNFFQMSTAASNIPIASAGYTSFYWAYWIAWAVATPLYLAKISKGRTIKQVVLGGLAAGLLGTFMSFIILGGGQQHFGQEIIANSTNLYDGIISVIFAVSRFEWFGYILILMLIGNMILLYSTTFDSIAHTMACYMTKDLDIDNEPTKFAKVFWALIFLILPTALIFTEQVRENLLTMSIIAAVPLAIIFSLVIISFFKDLRKEKLNQILQNQKLELEGDKTNV